MTTRWMTALLAAALLLTSCGASGNNGETSVELVQGAGAAVLAQKTARLEMRFEGAGQEFVMDGEIDFVENASTLAMDIPGVGVIDIVSSGTNLYVRKAGEGWTKIELTGEAAKLTTQGFGADPRAVLEQLTDADGITMEGTEDLRGHRTTKYRGRLDLEKAMRAQGITDDQIDLLNEQLEGAGEVDATVEVYLDDDGLAHRTISRTKIGSFLDITVTMDLLDFGVPVDIRVPSDDDVVHTDSASTQLELNTATQSIFAPD